LYVETPLLSGAEIAATSGQAHYLLTVLRRNAGDPVRLFNGRDGEWGGHIVLPGRDRAILRVAAMLRPQTPEPDLWLMFALLKRDATDLTVQKATELGAAALLPVITDRTIATRTNQSRLLAIAIEAAEQSERLTVPRMDQPCRLHERLDNWPAERRLFVAAERTAAPALRQAGGPTALLVGPEGGFTRVELDALQGYPFVTLVSLGPRILRAETACLAGLALLQAPGCG